MTRVYLQFLALCLFLSPTLFGKELSSPEEKSSEVAEADGVAAMIPTESFWLVPQVSVVMPTSLILKNKDFEIPYSKQFPSLSNFAIGVLSPLKVNTDFQLFAVGRLGFSFKEGIYGFERNSGESVRSKVKLSWLPASLGGKVQYAIPSFPFIKPSITMGGGIHWFYQTGEVAGLNSSFWIPYYFVSPALSFMEGTTSSDWFGGFTFGISYQNSFASPQTVRAWSFDLGINIFL